MPMHERETILRKLRAARVEEIGLFLWGESTTDKDLAKTVALARELGFSNIFLTCNGSLATSKKIEELMREGLTSLKFSMNAANAEDLAHIANVGPHVFERTLEHFEGAVALRDSLFKETGHYCLISASWILLYPGREAEMHNALERLERAVGEENVYLLPPYNISDGQLTEEQRGKGWIVTIGNPGTFHNPHPPIPCHIPFSMAIIDEHGNLCACCFHHGEHAPDFVIGSLLENDFEELWNGEALRALRRAHLESWKTRDRKPALCTACASCLTPPPGLTGLLPGQEMFLPRP